ncbi:DotU family type IV/VI secretion system protein [Sorangium sp. So ce321]|uniref:DotU family type IV/VI secretion system protein n=1 Tax=Sorangium sp. So ce321 TaxID=3133300 RepID=UPI003F5E1868
MSAALWGEVLAARREIDACIARALPSSADDSIGPDALEALRDAIRARLAKLEATLTGALGRADAAAAMLPIVLELDERVMARLSLGDRLDWPLLQDGVLRDENGGEVFYARLDALLRPQVKASMVHEVYYWCLEDGFCGRYEEGDPAIERYKGDLQRAMAKPKAQARPEDAPAGAAARPPGRRLPPAVYYTGTAILVALICVAPMLLSNL